MKSLIWKCVCIFLPSVGYSCLSFRGRRAPENLLWLASRPWDRIAFQDLLRQHQTGHLSQTSPQSCNPTQHGGKLISLYMSWMQTQKDKTDIHIIYACMRELKKKKTSQEGKYTHISTQEKTRSEPRDSYLTETHVWTHPGILLKQFSWLMTPQNTHCAPGDAFVCLEGSVTVLWSSQVSNYNTVVGDSARFTGHFCGSATSCKHSSDM